LQHSHTFIVRVALAMPSRLLPIVVVCLAVRPSILGAQVDQVVTPPPNIVLANYNGVPVGPFGGLEGQAVVARVGDPSSAWFNPAGLAQEGGAQVSGSAGVFERSAITPRALPNGGSSVQQLPSLVGFTIHVGTRTTLGFAALTTNSWSQEIDSELITATPDMQERFAYSADSEFSRRVFALAGGFKTKGPWRVGGGLSFSLTDLRQVQTVGDRVADADGLRTLLISARASGSAFQVRTQAGVQYDLPTVRLGATVRTPALTLKRDGSATLDGVLDAGTASLGASVFDRDAAFEYHQPWEFQGGAAYIRVRVQLEVDLQTFGSIAPYALLSTDRPTVIYGDAGRNAPPSIVTRPFGGLTSAADAVVNVAVGGEVRMARQRALRVHAGFATDNSPVAAADQVFDRVDMQSWTVGVSGAVRKLQFAVGINYRSGTAGDVALRNVIRSDAVRTAVDIRTTGLIYSLAYQF
jgi:hypothetical protein